MEPLQITLSERYLVTLTEYKKNLYLHIKDTRIKPGGSSKQVTLHAEGVLALEENLPKFTECINRFLDSVSTDGETSEPDTTKTPLRSLAKVTGRTRKRRKF